jgi:hypothetical protein
VDEHLGVAPTTSNEVHERRIRIAVAVYGLLLVVAFLLMGLLVPTGPTAADGGFVEVRATTAPAP